MLLIWLNWLTRLNEFSLRAKLRILSPKGFEQSAGIVVNYVYNLAKIDDNHEAYRSNQTVHASTQVKIMMKG